MCKLLTCGVLVALLFMTEAARAEFVNGVERFDGNVLDSSTWVPSSPTGFTQNDALTISNSTVSLTAKNFTLPIGQGVRAKVLMRPPISGYEDSFLYLSDRSAGLSSKVEFTDQHYVGVGVIWDEQLNRTGLFSTDGSVGILSRSMFASLTGNHTSEQFTIQVVRRDVNVFEFSAWNSANELLGANTRDVTVPLFPGAFVSGTIPSNLYVTLNAFATWDDVAIVPEPHVGWLGATLILLKRRRRIIGIWSIRTASPVAMCRRTGWCELTSNVLGTPMGSISL
jgi:hypothetical protein